MNTTYSKIISYLLFFMKIFLKILWNSKSSLRLKCRKKKLNYILLEIQYNSRDILFVGFNSKYLKKGWAV